MPPSAPDRDLSGEPNPERPSGVSPSVNALALESQQPTDVALFEHALAGRAPTDYDVMFAEHYERLVRTLTVVAGDRETAADAVQDAFVKAHLRWRKVSRYDDPAGWVRRVAINKLRDEHRRVGRKRRALGRLTAGSASSTPEHEIDEFDRLLSELPLQQRTSTALFYVHQLSIADIATTMRISEGSVKSHLHDARKRLRSVLEREALDGSDHHGDST